MYERISKIVDAVDPDAVPGHPIPPIVLDDNWTNRPCRETVLLRLPFFRWTAVNVRCGIPRLE
ncbi:hypothetical protein L3Q67_02590 [Saccharothrix sp. AJ9571]|nr:hypothetical protein L3Q67_02590 [Saccharothrix sp. AJ9571]